MTWQKCPVCDGRGSLPTGFYSGGPGIMRLPYGWTIGREKTENGVRRLTLVKMPPPKTGGWHRETAPPRPEDRVKGPPPPTGARGA